MTTSQNKPQTAGLGAKLATASASLAALGLAPAADAGVIHVTGRPVSQTWPSGNEAFWDVDGDSTSDFRLKNTIFLYNSNPYTTLNLDSFLYGRGIVGTGPATYKTVNNLSPGFVLGPVLASPYLWKTPTGFRTVVDSYGAVGSGPYLYGFIGGFAEGDNFFGFRFADKDNPADLFYGWATLNLGPLADGERTVTISSWAYNNTPDGSIRVGQTQDDPAEVPGPLGLAGLAAGAAWSRRLRRRIKKREAV
jgi:Uncharacterized protein conserved in bacteria